MPHVICQPCVGIKDMSCLDACPTDSIHPKPGEGDADQLFINPNTCSDCGLCVAACPRSAIYPDSAVPSQWVDYIQKNADYYG